MKFAFLGGRTKIHGRRQYVLKNKLSPFAAYQFRVAARNAIGLGEYSEPSGSFNTAPGVPYTAVNNETIRGGGGRTGDLTIVWDPLPRQEWNAPGVYYR